MGIWPGASPALAGASRGWTAGTEAPRVPPTSPAPLLPASDVVMYCVSQDCILAPDILRPRPWAMISAHGREFKARISGRHTHSEAVEPGADGRTPSSVIKKRTGARGTGGSQPRRSFSEGGKRLKYATPSSYDDTAHVRGLIITARFPGPRAGMILHE